MTSVAPSQDPHDELTQWSPEEAKAKVESKVRSARRRMMLGKFGRTFAVTWFVGLIVATIAVGAMAITPLPLDRFGLESSDVGATELTVQQWAMGWIAAVTVVSILVSAIVTWVAAPSVMRVAAEVDSRFGLKERLSSALSSDGSSDGKSAAGNALRQDAARRASKLNVAEKFALSPQRVSWLPLAIVPILAVMVFAIEPATEITSELNNEVNASEVRQVKIAAAELKKRLAQQKREADAKGLLEARELFEKMESQLDKITESKTLKRKDALLELNDIKEQIQARKDRLGSPEEMRKTLAQMKGLDGGPAQKVLSQIQKGEFGKAAEEIRKLAEQVKNGKLTDQQKEKLNKQIKKMAEQMKAAAKNHEEKKKQLQEKIDQAKREGRNEEAAKLQQKLNESESADAQMQQMQKMADAMQQAADAMQQGDESAAAQAMEEMSNQLGEMQMAMSELEDLESALGDLSQSKNQMNCKQCNGDGCQACQGQGFGEGEKPGMGMGRGKGKGDRPEEETDINTYDTQVRGKVKRGRAIIAGFADGPNRKGVTRADIQSAIESNLSEESDPLEDQVLPRDEREQTREYFDRLREGS
ncbi:membrane protein [Rhodopirellula europaea]|jgi:hypothetical protein|uniref:Putative membrane protein n=1 Tax=Rhodopirellula europaea SH398 TaxID=1263868 RepID=M5S4H6_9BACT|nr:membrane protein [Rhodopirellula europaea]EMI26356.1 putative membrane protein [Rhodopirellula europaea SH398]